MGLAAKMNPQIVEITEESPNHVCNFCHKQNINPIEWGPMYQLNDITLHYFCLLFSAGLKQNGEDNEGVLGFLAGDIRKEIRRGNKLKCAFCKKHGATVGCIRQSCKSSFHYTCGISRGTLHQFYDQFCSFCPKHKPAQNIPKEAEWTCPICFVEVESKDDAVWPPCCGKSVFHRSCLMRAAKSAGYFFKCPLCNNNSEKFLLTMRSNGVFVPEEDAAWEREPNAFAELQQQYSRCDANNCLCPTGRETDDKADMRWKIIRCGGCGATATHVKCSELQGVLSWNCETCLGIFADNSRVNISALASAPARSLRTHVDERNLNYSSESDDWTSEGTDSDTTSDEEGRIVKGIPSAVNSIRGDTSSESSDDSVTEADNSSQQTPQANIEPNPSPANEDVEQNVPKRPNGIIFNPTMNRQYRVVKKVEDAKKKRKRNQIIHNGEQEKKKNKLEDTERQLSGSSGCLPASHALPSSSTSIDKKRRHHNEKKSSRRRREKRAAARARAGEGNGNNDSEEAKLQSIFQDVPLAPSTSSARRRVEEAKKRKETIQSILKQSNEQVFDFSKLPKIPKLARPAKNGNEDHIRKSVVNIERLRQQEEERNQAIRNHRGTDPRLFYHKRHEPTGPTQPLAEPTLTKIRSVTTEFEPAAASDFTDDAPLHNLHDTQDAPLPSTFQAPSSSSTYSCPPIPRESRYLPEQTVQNVTGYTDDAPYPYGEGLADKLWYPFEEDDGHANEISDPPHLNNDEYSSRHQPCEQSQGRAVFTAFYDDTPVIHFRKPYNSNEQKRELFCRNYRRSNMASCSTGTETGKFYNPHSKLRRGKTQANLQKLRTDIQTPEVNVQLDPRQEENVSNSSTEDNGLKNGDYQPKPNARSSDFDTPLPDSTLLADDSDEIQIASPSKKPQVQVIEVIDLSDSDDDIEVISEKVVSRVSPPPITTVKSAAFLALVSGKPKPVPVRPESSATSSSSVGTSTIYNLR